MPKEVILCGFKVQVPLTPEDRLKLETIERGLYQLAVKVGLMPAFLVPLDGSKAIEALHAIACSLLAADRAAAAPSSSTRRS